MLIEVITAFLGVSLLLYCLLGGADFGAGIVELLVARRKDRDEIREVVSHAMGPVWEANHMWLILAVVILFNGFPRAFAALSTIFHIPLTIMLCGIILRGCAFTFRRYDVAHDRSERFYSAAFAVSSLVTSSMIGILVGGIALGRRIPPQATFYDAFVSPWLNPFSCAMGCFCCVSFTFLASVYLIGETEDEKLRRVFAGLAFRSNLAAMVLGGVVFAAAEYDGVPLAQSFFSRPLSLACVTAATGALAPLWLAVTRRHVAAARVCAAAIMAFVLLGWFSLHAPAILLSGGIGHPDAITIYNGAAPASTLWALLYALLGGSVLIFPAFFYLLMIFKFSATTGPSSDR